MPGKMHLGRREPSLDGTGDCEESSTSDEDITYVTVPSDEVIFLLLLGAYDSTSSDEAFIFFY
jgi:hypothetical protein